MASQVADNLKSVSELVDTAASSQASAKEIRATIVSLQQHVTEFESTISDATFVKINKCIKASEASLKQFLTADCMAKTFGKDQQALMKARIELQNGESAIFSQIMQETMSKQKDLAAKCQGYEDQIKKEEEKQADLKKTLGGEMGSLKDKLAQAFAGSNQRETEKKQMAEKHNGEIDEAKKTHEQTLASTKTSHEAAIADLTKKHNDTVQQLKDSHAAALTNTKTEAAGTLKATKDDLEAKLAQKTQEIAQKDGAVASAQKEKATLEGDHAKALKKAGEDAEKEKKSALDGQAKDHTKALKKVQGDLEGANKKVSTLEGELEAAKAE